MTFWLVAGGLSALAAGLLLWPLLRRPEARANRAAYDVSVYRDQLAEIERERGRGELDDEAAAAARTEVERRLLQAAERAAAGRRARAERPARAAVWAYGVGLGVLLPAASLGLYLALGSPGTPSQPFAERPAPEAPAMAGDMSELADRLAGRLAREPGDRDGWLLLGRTRIELGQYDLAAEALKLAIAHGFDDAETQGALGEALTARDRGAIGAEARAAFAAALEHDPDDPRARYYGGLALAQDGRLQQAIDVWTALVRAAPPDAPWLAVVATQIRQAAGELGVAPPELPARAAPGRPDAPAPVPAGPGAPGPNAADVEAAAQMSAEERAAFIRSMVARLAERLEAEPEDFDGWLRLARAYGVLGEAAKARAALGRAGDLVADLPAGAPERARLEAARRALPANP